MKKIIYLILLLIVMTPFKVKADSVSVSLDCPESAKSNAQISCKVKVTSDVKVNGLSGNYTLDGLSYVGFQPQSDFTALVSSSSGFAVSNTNGKKGTFTIGVITLKVNKAGSIKLSNLDASDTDFNDYSISSKTANIRIKSTNNSLENLTISKGTLTPAFDPDKTSYTVTLEDTSIVISATKGDKYQTIKGTGTKKLDYGENTFKVVVTSEAGSSKTYTIVVTRPDDRSTNNYLKSLNIDKGNINFNKKTITYSVDVDNNVNSIKISADLEDSKANFVSGYGPRTVNLDYGNNVVTIKVKAENESIRTYTINVNREDGRSKNNNLKSITLSEGNINFNKDTLEYDISVNTDVEKIEIEAIPEDDKAKVVINNDELEIGNNVIKIVVTSELGVEKTYILNVKRLSEDEVMSDNNSISKLIIKGYSLDFANDKTDYDLVIDDKDTELIFDIVLEDENASYTIDGNKNLENESIITITTTSESGISKEYNIKIIKEAENKLFPYVIISLISLLIGFLLGIMVAKIASKKNK